MVRLIYLLMKNQLHRYQFGTKTIGFWMCSDCGTYCAAVTNDEKLATINVNTLMTEKYLKQQLINLINRKQNNRWIITEKHWNKDKPEEHKSGHQFIK